MSTSATQENGASDNQDQTIIEAMMSETKYMKQYAFKTQTYGPGAKIKSIINNTGQVEFFLSYNGKIWNYFSDPSSATGFNAKELKFNVGGNPAAPLIFTVDKIDTGHIVVIAARGTKLQSMLEINSSGQRWEKAKDISLFEITGAPSSTASVIDSLYTRNVSGVLYIGVLTHVQQLGFKLAYRTWGASPEAGTESFTWVSEFLQTNNCEWTGQSTALVAFVEMERTGNTVRMYALPQKRWVQQTMAGSNIYAVKSIASVGNFLVALQRDGDILFLRENKEGGSWMPLEMWASDIALPIIDKQGTVFVFGVNRYECLYYTKSTDSGVSWSKPCLLAPDAQDISVMIDKDNKLNVFVLHQKQKIIIQLTYDNSSNAWTSTTITPQATQEDEREIEEFLAYSTDVTVTDNTGKPAVNTEVNITSASHTQIIVNGQKYSISDRIAANAHTDHTGKLSIIQPADWLSAQALQITVPSLDNKVYGLRQWEATVLPELQSLATAHTLKNAKHPDGHHLLPQEIRDDPDRLRESAEGFKACLDFVKTHAIPTNASSHVAKKQYDAGFGPIPPGSAARLSALAPQVNAVSGENAGSDVASQGQRMPQTGQFFDDPGMEAAWVVNSDYWLQPTVFNVDDLVKVMKVEVIPGLKTLAIKIGTQIKDKGGEFIDMLFNAVISSAVDALNAIRSIFSWLGVARERVTSWLETVFNWESILRTQSAVVHALDQVIICAGDSVEQLQEKVGAQFAEWKKTSADMFDKAEQKLNTYFDSSNLEAAPRTPKETEAARAASNNFMMRALIDSKGGGAPVHQAANAPDQGAKTALDNALTVLQTTESDELKAAAEANLGGLNSSSGQSNFLQVALQKLLQFMKAVASGLLTAAEKVITTLMGFVQSIISTLQALISAPWNIPFVSALYQKITGTELNLKSLLGLLIAIPSTAVWTAIRGKAPFKDSHALEEFKRLYTADKLRESLFGPRAPSAHARTKISSKKEVNQTKEALGFLSFAGGISAGICTILSTVNVVSDFVGGKALAIICMLGSGYMLLAPPMGNFTDAPPPFSGALWVASFVWFLADMASVIIKQESFLSLLTPADRIGAVVTGAVGIGFTVVTIAAIIAGEIQGPLNATIALCVPLTCIAMILSFKPIEMALNSMMVPAKLVLSAIGAVLGSITLAATFASIEKGELE